MISPMQKILTVLLIFFSFTFVAFSQTTWERIYPGYPEEDVSNFSCLQPDGNIILVGYVVDPSTKAKLIKIKPNGDTIWSKIIGFSGERYQANYILSNNDGSFIITGSMLNGVFLMKLDSSANIIWNKIYNSPLNGRSAVEMLQIPTGGYLLRGTNFLAKTDSIGNLIWHFFSSGFNESFQGICITNPNSFTLLGINYLSNQTGNYLIKYDFDHNVIWQKNIDSLIGRPLQFKFKNSNFHILGLNGSPTLDSTKFYIAKLDSQSNIISNSQMKFNEQEYAKGVFHVINNEKYVFSTWHSTSMIAETTKAVIRIINPQGTVLNSKEILSPLTGSNIFSNVIEIGNKDLLFTGSYQKQFGTHNTEFYAIRTDSNLFFKTTNVLNHNVNVANDFILFQNYPNPFNPKTKIAYKLKKSVNIELIVYDLNGKFIKLLDSGFKQSGQHEVILSLEDLSTGVYLYSLSVEGKIISNKKLIFIK